MLLKKVDFSRSMKTISFIAAWLPFTLFAIPAWFFLWSPALEYRNSETWVAVPCAITTASKRPTSDGDRWSSDLRYDYVFAGISYQGVRLAFGSVVVGGGPGDLPALPALGNSICYVDPHNPSVSVLRREYDQTALYVSWGLAAVVAILAIGALLWTRLLSSGKIPFWSEETLSSS